MQKSRLLWVLCLTMLSASFLFAITSCAVEPANEDEAYDQALTAASDGHVSRLEYLTRTWPNLVRRTKFGGQTLLFAAATRDRAEAVELLIQRGAEVNYDNDHESALSCCVMSDARRAAKVLLEHGADPNFRPVYTAKNGMKIYSPTALETAANWSYIELAEMFFQHGAKVELNPPTGFSALHQACKGRTSGRFQYSPEIFENTKRMISLLVEKGYDINGRTKSGNATPLMEACEGGTLDIAEYLLTRPDVTDVNAIDIDDYTALDAVFKHKPSPQRERVVQALRARGALTMDEIRLKQRQEEKKKRDAENRPVGCATLRWATAC